MLHANIQPPPSVRKWKTVFSFSKRASASFAPLRLDARAPNQVRGLACAGHGAPRAALVMNDLRIRRVGAQHPVESYRQLARRRHLRYSLRLAVAAMLILFSQPFVESNCRLVAASTSNMRTKLFPCFEIAPSRCLPPELCSLGISPR